MSTVFALLVLCVQIVTARHVITYSLHVITYFQFLHVIGYKNGCFEKEDGSETSYSGDCYYASGSGKPCQWTYSCVGIATDGWQFCHSGLGKIDLPTIIMYVENGVTVLLTYTLLFWRSSCIGDSSESRRSFQSDSSSDAVDSTGTTGWLLSHNQLHLCAALPDLLSHKQTSLMTPLPQSPGPPGLQTAAIACTRRATMTQRCSKSSVSVSTPFILLVEAWYCHWEVMLDMTMAMSGVTDNWAFSFFSFCW